MRKNIPTGWSIRKITDSTLCFNKLIHWDNKVDPPEYIHDYNDTMSVYIQFHVYQDEVQKINHQLALQDISLKKQTLIDQRSDIKDTIYRGKKGFYDFMDEMAILDSEQLRNEYTYFKKCSITFAYWQIYNPLITYNPAVNEEVKLIKERLIHYLKK